MDKIKGKLNIKSPSLPVYDEKYIKAKVREFSGVIKTNFLDDELPKENDVYTCITCITIDFVMRMEKNYPQVYLEAKLKGESESELESDIELELKSGTEYF